MARHRKLEEQLEQLDRIRGDPSAPAALSELRAVLARGPALAVAKAARIAGESAIDALEADLVAAFARLLAAPAKAEPGCAAKKAVVDALLRLEPVDDAVFRAGIRHVQPEPVWGGQVDTAVDLRAACGFGLARSPRGDVLEWLAELLADPEPPARAAAARAIGAYGGLAALPLLRHKALAGDAEPRVVTECLLTLLHLDPPGSLPFVCGLLEPRPVPGQPSRDRAECAALALGESRLKEALPVLRDWYPRALERRLGRTAAGALAALRHDEAFDFLLSVVAAADLPAARDAIEALAEQANASLAARVREAAFPRPALLQTVERVFTDRDR